MADDPDIWNVFDPSCRKYFPKAQDSSSMEIFDSETPECEEEEEEPPIKQPSNCLEVLQELQCMKLRIRQIQWHIKMKIDDVCPERECENPEILVDCSENKEICELQKNQYKMQCQLNDLIKCFEVAKNQIKEIRIRICQKTRDIMKLEKLAKCLAEWRIKLNGESEVCKKRFEYLMHAKADWSKVESKLKEVDQTNKKTINKYLTKKVYNKEKCQFVRNIQEVRTILRDLTEYQMRRFSLTTEQLNQLDNIDRNPAFAFDCPIKRDGDKNKNKNNVVTGKSLPPDNSD